MEIKSRTEQRVTTLYILLKYIYILKLFTTILFRFSVFYRQFYCHISLLVDVRCVCILQTEPVLTKIIQAF